MAKTANLNIRLDPDIKKNAEAIYSYYGLSLTEAVTVFIYQSCNVGGLPFDLRPVYPNALTLDAINEADFISQDDSAPGYSNVDDLFAELDSDG